MSAPLNPMTADELEFLKAMERFIREKHVKFPKWTQVLAILKSLGYRKVEADEPVVVEVKEVET